VGGIHSEEGGARAHVDVARGHELVAMGLATKQDTAARNVVHAQAAQFKLQASHGFSRQDHAWATAHVRHGEQARRRRGRAGVKNFAGGSAAATKPRAESRCIDGSVVVEKHV